MLSSLKNIFKVPDLRNKVLFTLADDRASTGSGAHLPVPGIDLQAIKQLKDQAETGGALGFLKLFSGGALTLFAIFALGIMPYITASIIMQILGVVIPKLEEWQNQGAVGQRKITQWTRYVTIAIALLQAHRPARSCSTRGGGHSFTGQAVRRRPVPDFDAGAGAARRAHPHRRRGAADVAGRAHHPAGHRQRHVAADLRLGGQHAAVQG